MKTARDNAVTLTRRAESLLATIRVLLIEIAYKYTSGRPRKKSVADGFPCQMMLAIWQLENPGRIGEPCAFQREANAFRNKMGDKPVENSSCHLFGPSIKFAALVHITNCGELGLGVGIQHFPRCSVVFRAASHCLVTKNRRDRNFSRI